MAGRIVDNTIVAGYPEPGVTADEIVGLVNRFGMPLGTLDSAPVKQYSDTIFETLVNTWPSIGPAFARRTVSLESWALVSNVHVSVSAMLFGDALVIGGVDDNTLGGVAIYTGLVERINTYGAIGQSNVDGANNVGWHSLYEAHWVGQIPAGEAVDVIAEFSMNGNGIVVKAELAGVFVEFRINITRVIE